MAFIFYMSSRAAPEEVKWLPIIAKLKLVHIIEYGILYLLFLWPIRKTTTLANIEAFSVAFMLILIYGLTDEFHQIFVVGRTASLVDAVANGVGAVLMQGCIILKKSLTV
jgi:VanZ family protein